VGQAVHGAVYDGHDGVLVAVFAGGGGCAGGSLAGGVVDHVDVAPEQAELDDPEDQNEQQQADDAGLDGGGTA
jgi:hypothetical protein